ncbi:hypothetical protein STEG23_004268 [Scotinomys teguina]
MESEKYYFEHDIYGIGFYEEEVTSELQNRRAAAGNSEEVAGILEYHSHVNAVIDHSYSRIEKNSTCGKSCQLAQGRQEPVPREPTKDWRKLYKFTHEQLFELNRVFQETLYPNKCKRKELAELIDVAEHTVKVWFHKQRSKFKKDQMAILRKSTFHGGNAMVLETGEEGGKAGLRSKLAQHELDQGKFALGELAPSKPDQEELAQSSFAQEATGMVEEREKKEEEMGGGHAGHGSSGPVDKGIHEEGDHGVSVQQEPEQEAAMPEGTKSLQAGDRLPFHHRTRLTQSQLQDLENLFEGTPYPSLGTRIGLKTGEPVQGEAENVDAVRCTTWSPEQGSLKILEQH